MGSPAPFLPSAGGREYLREKWGPGGGWVRTRSKAARLALLGTSILAACNFYEGHQPLVTMHRPSDGIKVACGGDVYSVCVGSALQSSNPVSGDAARPRLHFYAPRNSGRRYNTSSL